MTGPRRGGLLRANVSVGLGTALSRATGLLRWVALAAALGQASLSDAFNLANNSPNAVYELLLGGVLSATLVPVFTAQLEDADDDATNAVVTVAAIALAVLTVVAIVAAPWIVRLLTLSPDESVDAAQLRDVGTDLARLLLPQIFFYGMMALGSALLNARRRFFAPAWAPVLNNIVVIAVFVVVGLELSGEPDLEDAQTISWLVPTLGLGSTAGIVVMTLALVPALRRARRAAAVPPRLAASGGAQGPAPVGVDDRLRRRQPDRAAGHLQPHRARRRRPLRLPARVRVLPAAPRAAGGVDHHHVHPGPGPGLAPRRPGRLQRPHVARPARPRPPHHPGLRGLPGAGQAPRRGGARSAARSTPPTPTSRPTPWPPSPSACSASRPTCSCCGASTRSRTRRRRSGSTSARTP